MISSCVVMFIVRIVCGKRNRRKDVHHNTTVRVASPGPSIKSVGSREYDGNESDEKNPDVIPESMDSDQDQVTVKMAWCVFDATRAHNMIKKINPLSSNGHQKHT